MITAITNFSYHLIPPVIISFAIFNSIQDSNYWPRKGNFVTHFKCFQSSSKFANEKKSVVKGKKNLRDIPCYIVAKKTDTEANIFFAKLFFFWMEHVLQQYLINED